MDNVGDLSDMVLVQCTGCGAKWRRSPENTSPCPGCKREVVEIKEDEDGDT